MRETAIQGHLRSSVPGLSDFLVLPVCMCELLYVRWSFYQRGENFYFLAR